MVDWIHCNFCFLRNVANAKFLLTDCGHILCEKCTTKIGPEKNCIVCKKRCNIIHLSKDLQPDVKRYFESPDNECEKLKQICKFQISNILGLLKNVSSKYSYAKVELSKLWNNCNALKRENNAVKRENQQLREMLNKSNRSCGSYSTSTPIMPDGASPFGNSSIPSIINRNINTSFMIDTPPSNQMQDMNLVGNIDMGVREKCAGFYPRQQSTGNMGVYSSQMTTPSGFEERYRAATPRVAPGLRQPSHNLHAGQQPALSSMAGLRGNSNNWFHLDKK